LSVPTVTNSTCLIGLERIGRLDILPQVFLPVTIPLAVQTEVGLSAEWLTVQAVKNLAVVATLKTQIDAGEAEAIALAMELEDVFIILDDRNARRIAQQLGLKVIGTVGMLLRAKQKNVIAEIKPLLTALEAADFRIAEPLVQNALRLAGEL
jgi:predicted nucleic acid-binding protein